MYIGCIIYYHLLWSLTNVRGKIELFRGLSRIQTQNHETSVDPSPRTRFDYVFKNLRIVESVQLLKTCLQIWQNMPSSKSLANSVGQKKTYQNVPLSGDTHL